jgi:hypothetical protein
LRALFEDLPVRIAVHTQIYPGYDNLLAGHPALARWLRWATYGLEQTPFRVLGLSHFLVAEKTIVSRLGVAHSSSHLPWAEAQG